MEIKFILKNELSTAPQQRLKTIEETCFEISSEEIMKNGEKGHPFGAIECGVLVLLDGGEIVGNAYVYKRQAEYDGQKYFLGGIGGLAVMPEYRGMGYARQLTAQALNIAAELGVDIACLFMDRDNPLHKFYASLGYKFLDRRCYYIDSLQKEAYFDNVMILGLNDKSLAEKMLSTSYKFHYGEEEGCW